MIDDEFTRDAEPWLPLPPDEVYEGDGALSIVEGDPRDWDDPSPAWNDT